MQLLPQLKLRLVCRVYSLPCGVARSISLPEKSKPTNPTDPPASKAASSIPIGNLVISDCVGGHEFSIVSKPRQVSEDLVGTWPQRIVSSL